MLKIRLYPMTVARKIEKAIYPATLYQPGETPYNLPESLFYEEFPAIVINGVLATVYNSTLIEIPPAFVNTIETLND